MVILCQVVFEGMEEVGSDGLDDQLLKLKTEGWLSVRADDCQDYKCTKYSQLPYLIKYLSVQVSSGAVVAD